MLAPECRVLAEVPSDQICYYAVGGPGPPERGVWPDSYSLTDTICVFHSEIPTQMVCQLPGDISTRMVFEFHSDISTHMLCQLYGEIPIHMVCELHSEVPSHMR